MAKKEYLYAVQRPTGHELVSVKVEGATPVVTAEFLEDGRVRLVREGETLATSENPAPEGEEITLYRWAADAKTEPPSHTSLVSSV